MQTNFDYLKNEEKFSAFSDVAISAEKIVLIDPEACVINCRRAMEFAVKWITRLSVALKTSKMHMLFLMIRIYTQNQLRWLFRRSQCFIGMEIIRKSKPLYII